MAGGHSGENGRWSPIRKVTWFCAPGLFYLAIYYSYWLLRAIGLRRLPATVTDRLFFSALAAVALSPLFTVSAAAVAIGAQRRGLVRGREAAFVWVLIVAAAYAFFHFLRYVLLVGARWY